jgi:competence protein ComEA
MPPWNTKALSPSPPPSRWASFVARVRASTWPPIAGRVAGVVVALLVLGWIGRTAAANPSSPVPAPAMSAMATDHALAVREPDASAPPIPAVVPVDAGAPIVAHGRASTTEPVYINHASVDELRRLPGVGPKRAEAILALRQRVGRFQRVEDLLRVKGVGRGAVKKWRPLVRLDAPDAGSP